MKTPEQLKGTIRSMAAKRNLRAQEVLQMFLFERILERLANSKYKMNFILKGGLLISSMIGISERTTMDMDTTVRGIQMEEDDIVRIVKEILTGVFCFVSIFIIFISKSSYRILLWKRKCGEKSIHRLSFYLKNIFHLKESALIQASLKHDQKANLL
jgi:hypothetical protein